MHELLILGLLYDQELHGYQIKQKADFLLKGMTALSYGTLYPKLKKLEKHQFISSKTNFSKGGQEKTSYTIDDKGKDLFQGLMETTSNEGISILWLRFQVKLLFFKHINKELAKTLIDNIRSVILAEINIINNSQKEELDYYKKAVLAKTLSDLENHILWLDTLILSG